MSRMTCRVTTILQNHGDAVFPGVDQSTSALACAHTNSSLSVKLSHA